MHKVRFIIHIKTYKTLKYWILTEKIAKRKKNLNEKFILKIIDNKTILLYIKYILAKLLYNNQGGITHVGI